MSINGQSSPPSRSDLENTESFGRLTVVVRQRLHPFISRAVRDPHVTEDLLQETLLVMIERLSGLKRAECFWPWVYRVAQRKIQDHFRQQQRWATVEENTRCEARRRFRAIYGRAGALDQMIGAENTHGLSDAIGQMNWRQQQIVRLRCFEQLPYAEIADRTRMSPAQARINFYRAKTFLKKHLCALSA
jgi:RNA polymerase sigma factor (sigma-70 family)